MAHHIELERTALYALGTLPDAESGVAEAHLAECAECLREYGDLHEIASAVALSAEAGNEHELRLKRIKQRLGSAIERQPRLAQLRPAAAQDTWYRALAVASITIAAGSLLWAATLMSKLQAGETALHDANARASVVLAADARVSEVATGLVVKRANRLYLAMNKLPELPAHHRFQVWLAVTGKKEIQPSVLFSRDSQGTAFVEVPEQSTAVQAIALSIEPENGSLQPSTAPLFVHPVI